MSQAIWVEVEPEPPIELERFICAVGWIYRLAAGILKEALIKSYVRDRGDLGLGQEGEDAV